MAELGREKCELAGSLLEVGSDYSGKSVTTIAADAPLSKLQLCPKCKSAKVDRNGSDVRYGVRIQRYKCQNHGCGLRFSDVEDLARAAAAKQRFIADSLNFGGDYRVSIQVCDKNMVGSKNLGSETQQSERCVSQEEKLKDTNISSIELVIADYKHYIQKEHIVNDLTLSRYVVRLRRLATEFKIDLFNPDDFKTKLAFDPVMSNWTNCNKNSYCKAYASFIKSYMHMKDVKIPHFEYKCPEYDVPSANHMELLYSMLSDQMRVFCYVLMATAARPIEALRIEWKDINFALRTISINHPAKHGRTRTIQLKGRFIKILDMLSEWKTHQYDPNVVQWRGNRSPELVFTYKDTDAAGHNFRTARERAVNRLGGPEKAPELMKITFYSNRHWRAVLERYLKGNSDAVANLLGENSDKYVQVYAPISERLYGNSREFDPVEILETDPDYSEKMERYGREGYIEYNYNRTTGRHYLRKEKCEY
jgi:integrase